MPEQMNSQNTVVLKNGKELAILTNKQATDIIANMLYSDFGVLLNKHRNTIQDDVNESFNNINDKFEKKLADLELSLYRMINLKFDIIVEGIANTLLDHKIQEEIEKRVDIKVKEILAKRGKF